MNKNFRFNFEIFKMTFKFFLINVCLYAQQDSNWSKFQFFQDLKDQNILFLEVNWPKLQV